MVASKVFFPEMSGRRGQCWTRTKLFWKMHTTYIYIYILDSHMAPDGAGEGAQTQIRSRIVGTNWVRFLRCFEQAQSKARKVRYLRWFWKAQPSKARVLRCFWRAQPSKARVWRCFWRAQPSKARVLLCFWRAQPSKARVLRCFRRVQPS